MMHFACAPADLEGGEGDAFGTAGKRGRELFGFAREEALVPPSPPPPFGFTVMYAEDTII